MATITAKPKKEPGAAEEAGVRKEQTRPLQLRYRLMVDRQTKDTYNTFEEAETRGKFIKAAFPIVTVAIYDAQESSNTTIEAEAKD